MKDKKKCFAVDDLGYEPEAVAIHPTGSTAAVGGAVRLHFQKLYYFEHWRQLEKYLIIVGVLCWEMVGDNL